MIQQRRIGYIARSDIWKLKKKECAVGALKERLRTGTPYAFIVWEKGGGREMIFDDYYAWLSKKLGMKVDIDILEKLIAEGKLPEEYELGRYLDTLLPDIRR